jgi:hypothetical protein
LDEKDNEAFIGRFDVIYRLYRDQSPHHPEHLVLSHPETVTVGGSRKRSVGLLVTLVLTIRCVVGRDEASMGAGVAVALIRNVYVTTTSKGWSVVGVIVDQLSGFDGDEFFFEVEGEDERAPRGVADELIVWDGVPFVGSEGGDGLSEFRPDQCERVLRLPALFMEGSRPEPVL